MVRPRGMGNVLSTDKQQQVQALGRLGWSLRRIQEATGARRETASAYLKEAGIAVRGPGRWGHGPPKPAIEVITGSDPAESTLGHSKQSICEPFRNVIELLSHGQRGDAVLDGEGLTVARLQAMAEHNLAKPPP